MADEQQAISVIKTLYSGSETPIAPGEAGAQKKVELVLQPIEGEAPTEDYTWAPYDTSIYYPQPNIGVVIPGYSISGEGAVLLNIETTGINPWESRITDIAVKRLGDPSFPVIHFTNADEVQMLRDFASWYVGGAYTQIIGYNTSFDFRFIFVGCMRYGIKIPTWATSSLYDLQEVMQQVFTKYVYGNNKSGKLDDWTLYLFNEKAPLTPEQLLKAWTDGDIQAIKDCNEWKVNKEFLLLSLIEYTLTP